MLHIAVIFFHLFNVKFLSAFLFFGLAFLKTTGQLFCRMPLSLGFSWCFLVIRLRVCILDRNTIEGKFCSSQCIVRRYRMFICSVTCGRLECFVRVLSARALHYIVTVSLYNNLGGNTLRLYKYPIFHQNFIYLFSHPVMLA